jgi:hypothetical protein
MRAECGDVKFKPHWVADEQSFWELACQVALTKRQLVGS